MRGATHLRVHFQPMLNVTWPQMIAPLKFDLVASSFVYYPLSEPGPFQLHQTRSKALYRIAGISALLSGSGPLADCCMVGYLKYLLIREGCREPPSPAHLSSPHGTCSPVRRRIQSICLLEPGHYGFESVYRGFHVLHKCLAIVDEEGTLSALQGSVDREERMEC